MKMASKENIKQLLLNNRKEAFEQLYLQAFPMVASFVSRMGGSFDDSRDIFQDAVIVLYEKAVEGNLEIRGSAQAYVVGIAKHMWTRKYKEGLQKVSFDDVEKEINIPDDFYYPQGASLPVIHYLEMAGQKCMDILQSFYYQQMSMETIARAFGFGSTRSATVQKFKCLEKVREKVKNMDYEEVFG